MTVRVGFILFDHPLASPIHDNWKKYTNQLLGDNQGVTVINSAFEDLENEFDCLVSPANSYGIMDGGIDMSYSRAFSGGGDELALSRSVQDVLVNKYFGFAPPTTCTLVPIPQNLRNTTRFPKCRFLAVCPTMRVPSNVSWHEDLVYNMMWSLLVELEHWNAEHGDVECIRTVAIPGMATGIGMFDKAKCAYQMILAISHFRAARSQDGRKRLADRAWTTNWDNILENAMAVVDE